MWREAVVKEMKYPIKLNTLASFLGAHGLSDIQIGVKYSSRLVTSLSREAKARYGGQSGLIIIEPEKTKRQKDAGLKFLGP